MKYLTLLLLPILLAGCYSNQLSTLGYQIPNFDAKYENYIDSEEKFVLSQYHYVITKLPDNTYRKRIFFPETMTLTSDFMYTDKDTRNKNGQASIYSDQGVLESQGNYKNNKRNGEWKFYSRYTGKISQEGNYLNGDKTGKWITYKKGFKSSETTYKNDIENGPFQQYDSLMNVINQGVYVDGEITEQTIEESLFTSADEVFYIVEQVPYLSSCKGIVDDEERTNCSTKALLEYVYSNIKYPKLAREYGVEGQVIAQFVVDENGDVTDIEIIRGICQDMKEECLKIVQSLPSWEPGMQAGKPVKVKYTLPIKFKLE